MSHTDRASLEGLLDTLQSQVHALHDYFIATGDTTAIRLPLTDAELDTMHVKNAKMNEVREAPPLYLIRWPAPNKQAPRWRGLFSSSIDHGRFAGTWARRAKQGLLKTHPPFNNLNMSSDGIHLTGHCR